MVPLPRSGAPHAIIEEERDTLVDIVENENPFITWCDLTGEMESAGEPYYVVPSLRRLFADMNCRKWKNLQRPHLTDIQARARLRWA
jgi:hypothetical protein